MENEKIILPAQRIKDKMVNGYLNYIRKTFEEVLGNEGFTLFDKVSEKEKEFIITRACLNKFELPALLMQVRENSFIVCTSEHLMKVENETIEKYTYEEIYGFNGFPHIEELGEEQLMADWKGRMVYTPKAEGCILPFIIYLSDRREVHWDMPTGHLRIRFWNVVKKFFRIGRKYQIEEYLEDKML